jgi:GMP synthase-like glutamine amidotransferase
MKQALVLVHEPGGGAGQIGRRLIERGVTVDTHLITVDHDLPNEATPFPDPGPYDFVVAMGSIRSLTRKAEIDSWIHDELDLLRSSHEAGVPILGICFGGQLLAEALGGAVETAPVMEIGWYEITEPAGVTNPVGPGPWFEWHHDRFTPPATAEVLARTKEAVQLFRLDRTVGTQFHPEIDLDHVGIWLNMADDAYLSEIGCNRGEILTEVRAREAANIAQCNHLVDWFLDEVAFPDREPARGQEP